MGIICLFFFSFIKSYSDLSNGLPPFNWGTSKAWPLTNAKSGPQMLAFGCCSSVENDSMTLKDGSLDLFIPLLLIT